MNSNPFVHIGLNHVVQASRVMAIIPPELKTGRRYLELAKERGIHIDASRGRRYRSLLLLDDGTVITCATSIMTLLKRFNEPIEKYPTDYRDDDLADLMEFDEEEGE